MSIKFKMTVMRKALLFRDLISILKFKNAFTLVFLFFLSAGISQAATYITVSGATNWTTTSSWATLGGAGTISVTSGSNSITGVGTTFTAALVGKNLYTSSGQLIGTVLSRTSNTAITLAAGSLVTVTNGAYYVEATAAPTSTDVVTVNHSLTLDTNITVGAVAYTFNANVTDSGTHTLTSISTGGSLTISNNSTTTIGGAVTLDNSSLTVNSGSKLITGPWNISNGTTISVSGTLIVNGDIVDNNNGSGTFVVSGYVYVNGNYSTSVGGVAVSGGGNFDTAGSITTTGGSTVFGSTTDCTGPGCSGTSLSCTYTNSVRASSQALCSGNTTSQSIIFATTDPSYTITKWQSSTDLVTFTDIANTTTSLPSQTVSQDTWFRVIFTSTTCGSLKSSSAFVDVNSTIAPTTATNGSTQSTCTTATLSGNTPLIGTGAWSVVSGPSTSTSQFSSLTSPTATFTPAGGAGSYVVQWTISTCLTSTANATITITAGPTITGTTPASRCGTGTVSLGAAASAGTINWYAAATGGSSLGTGTSFVTPSISSTTTYYADATSTCTTATRTSIAATVLTGTTWTGLAGDGLWTSSGNWTCGLPTSTVDVTVPGSTTIQVPTNLTATAKNLLITGTLTLNSGSTLQVYGDFTNNGTFNYSTSTTSFLGTTQSITGSSTTNFYNVNISNTSGTVSLNSNANLYGTLALPLTTSSFDADGSGSGVLTVISSASTSAAGIGVINSSAAFTGNITVQRTMGAVPANSNRYISMPVTGMVLNTDLSELGLSSGGFIYNESTAGTQNFGWVQTAKTYAFEKGRGFVTYNSPLFWDVRGPLTSGSNRGDVVLPVSFTNTSSALSEEGWNLVGNPYPSAINWNNTADWSVSNIDPIIYIPDLQGNTFVTYNSTTGGNIALGQGFWIKANAASPSVTVKESAKRSTGGTFYRKSSEELPALKIALSNGAVTDYSLLILHNDATSNYDKGIDAFKLEGRLMGISMISEDNMKLVHYATDKLSDKDIALNVMATQEGTFTLSFDSEIGSQNFEDLFLIDKYTNTVYPIAFKTPYQFEVTQNANSKEGRFFLSKNSTASSMGEVKIYLYPNPVTESVNIEVNSIKDVSVSVYNMAGVRVQQSVIESKQGMARGSIDMKEYSSGLYMFKSVVEGKMVVNKVIKK